MKGKEDVQTTGSLKVGRLEFCPFAPGISPEDATPLAEPMGTEAGLYYL